MKFSPDGKYLVTVGFYWGDIQIWEVPTGKLLNKISVHSSALEFSPDSKFLAYYKGKEFRVWDIRKGKEIKRLEGHQASIKRISFSDDGKLVATSDGKNTIIWNTTNWTVEETISGARISQFISERTLATFGPGKHLQLWDVNCG